MTREEREAIEVRLREVVFSLTWYDEKGKEAHGTGFFISADGLAVTAYHNLSPEVRNCPEGTQGGKFKGNDIAFHWALPGEADRSWQEKHEIAILQAQTVPEGLKLVNCFFLGSHIEGRGSKWAERDVLMLGYPASVGFALKPVTGSVNRIKPLGDYDLRRTDGTSCHLSDTIQIEPDHSGELADLRGMSGAPVYDRKCHGVVGVAVGVERQLSAVELWPIAEKWPRGKEVLKKLPVTRPVPPLRWSWLVLLITLAAVVLSWWYLRQPRPIPKELAVDILRLDSKHREKLTGDSQFNEGERVRFLLTSPVPGFLYVVDQELDSNGAPGQPELIFPTTTTGNGRNRVFAGAEIPFPAEDEDPPYLHPEPPDGDQDYGGELLTVLVFADPLKIELKPDATPLTPDQFPLDKLKPRLFQHKSSATGDALAVQQIRVAVHGKGR
jgi:hypothetical protein